MDLDISPAFDYDRFGGTYSTHRKADPRIEAQVHAAMRNAKSILNVGAGTGSYEPQNKAVTSVEPSKEMRSQRLKLNRTPAINASAESLPFEENSFDACMASITIHQWADLRKGLHEMLRVARQNVVILTFNPERFNRFWGSEYFPELVEIESQRFPSMTVLNEALGGNCEVLPVPIPLDCTDGFQEAFFGRPEAFLDPEVRRNQSAWGFLPEGKEEELVLRLKKDLESGNWDQKHAELRSLTEFFGSLQLVIAQKT